MVLGLVLTIFLAFNFNFNFNFNFLFNFPELCLPEHLKKILKLYTRAEKSVQ